MSDAAVAAFRELGVDIAVDLKGYTQDGRPGILAHRAAPVQVSWLGYPGTLAAPYADYVLADAVVLPPGAESDWSEAVVRLPLYQPNDALLPAPSAAQPRRGGPAGHAFVFCCLNNPGQDHARDLRGLDGDPGPRPTSVLWLYEGAPGAAANLRARRGGGDRSPAGWCSPRPPARQHLARQALADLMLDTWPYGAHTTASDALRMGVPVLTLPGELRQPGGRQPADRAGLARADRRRCDGLCRHGRRLAPSSGARGAESPAGQGRGDLGGLRSDRLRTVPGSGLRAFDPVQAGFPPARFDIDPV
jgi:protein O-GlcNAc transferase